MINLNFINALVSCHRYAGVSMININIINILYPAIVVQGFRC
jgi:hypothetical protein